jgi:hypothetical protein
MCKGVIRLQGPYALVVPVVGGDASLLTERPKLDRAVGAAGYALQTKLRYSVEAG